MVAITKLNTLVFGSKAAGLDQSMLAWRNNKRLPGLVSCNESDIVLAYFSTHRKPAKWLGSGQGPVAGLNSAWDLLLGDQACEGLQFGPL